MYKVILRIAIALSLVLSLLACNPVPVFANEYSFTVIDGVAQNTYIVKSDEHLKGMEVTSLEEGKMSKYRLYDDYIRQGDFHRGQSFNIFGSTSKSPDLSSVPCEIGGEELEGMCLKTGDILSVEVGGQSSGEVPRIPHKLTATIKTVQQ